MKITAMCMMLFLFSQPPRTDVAGDYDELGVILGQEARLIPSEASLTAPPGIEASEIVQQIVKRRSGIDSLHVIYSRILDAATSADFQADSEISRGYIDEYAFKGQNTLSRLQLVDMGNRLHSANSPFVYATKENITKWWPEFRKINTLDYDEIDSENSRWLESVVLWLPRSQRPEPPGFYLSDVEVGSTFSMMPFMQQVDGVPCLILERSGLDVIWVDPATDYSIRRRLWRQEATGGMPPRSMLYELYDYREAIPGLWFPWQVKITVLAPDSDEGEEPWVPIYVSHISVGHLAVNNVPDSLFTPPRYPGTIVFRMDADGRSSVDIIPGGEELLDRAISRNMWRFRNNRSVSRTGMSLSGQDGESYK